MTKTKKNIGKKPFVPLYLRNSFVPYIQSFRKLGMLPDEIAGFLHVGKPLVKECLKSINPSWIRKLRRRYKILDDGIVQLFCVKCKKWFPYTDFVVTSSAGRRFSYCKLCVEKDTTAWRAKKAQYKEMCRKARWKKSREISE